MSFGGIIAGALGGLGQGAQVVGQNLNASAMQDQQAANQKDLIQMQSDLSLQKEKAIEQFRTQLGVDTANSQRQAMVDRIGAAKTGIIGQALKGKYGDYDAALAGTPNSGTPLTPEQQDVINQSQDMVGVEKSGDAAALQNNPDIATQAAIATGDIDPAKAATLASTKEIQAVKAENYARSVEARLEAAKDRTDMMGIIAQLRAESAGGDGKMPSDAKMIEYLVKNGMDRQTATDRVTGTGAGATKDPVAMATQLASSLINNGTVRLTKDDPPGTTLASKAMDIASGQIQSAEQRFGRGQTSPAPAPAGAPGAPQADPLKLFPKKK